MGTLSPSIDKIQPPDQSQLRVEKAALALAALMRVPGLPPVGGWKISATRDSFASDGAVSGGVDVLSSDPVAANGAKQVAVHAWASRFGGEVVTRPLSLGAVLVDMRAEFEFDGVAFTVWAHVLPVGIGVSS